MIEEGRECREVMEQLSAASKALDRVGFKLLASQLRHCLRDEETARKSGYSPEEFERMFMSLSQRRVRRSSWRRSDTASASRPASG